MSADGGSEIVRHQSKTVARNQLALCRLSLLEQFFALYKSVQCLLDEYRLNIMRATKSTLVAGAAVGSVSALLASERELSPTVWVETAEMTDHCSAADCAPFALNSLPTFAAGEENAARKRTTRSDGKEADGRADSEQHNTHTHANFRPFGPLESQSVKAARKNIQTLLPLLCDLANIQRQMLSLGEEANGGPTV